MVLYNRVKHEVGFSGTKNLSQFESDSDEVDEDESRSVDEGEEEENEHDTSGHESGSDISKQQESDSEKPVGNAGWADAISKVLRTTKPKRKKTLVLSRAKKLTDISSSKQDVDNNFEIDGDTETAPTDEKPDVSQEKRKIKEIKQKKRIWDNMCRVKPNILEKERERALSKIATKGVVQLFNAVRQQQKSIEASLKAVGGSERRQEKVLRSVDKNSFLDILMGPTRSTIVGHSANQVEPKLEVKNEELKDAGSKAPLWKVLRDDFLVGGKLKDWDRKEVTEEEPAAADDNGSDDLEDNVSSEEGMLSDDNDIDSD